MKLRQTLIKVPAKELKRQLDSSISINGIIDELADMISTSMGIPIPKSQIELVIKLFTVNIVNHLEQGMAVHIDNFGVFATLCQEGCVRKAGFIKRDVDNPPQYVPVFIADASLTKSFNEGHPFGSLDLGPENAILDKYLTKKA